ncbi:hypothetical protein GP486_005272 [Trichoglossum hirsutum]|uniref:DUF676 domain-containing protein n=1 Tax=Trichoglossum hirsutum TaxID=265104 RepID=A0A9P8L9J4_9PEZI|nr:hypothetical protein GP486_005272 [Trichoglossum hirsutum]
MANLGLLILASGEGPVVADIIFVHGLRGDRINSWSKGNIVWPRDLLPAVIPNARIMTWGYDSDVMNFFSKSGKSSIYAHAWQLLEDINLKRKTPEERIRPIIFVAHSLGGIVVKDALCNSYNESKEEIMYKPRLAAIKPATAGLVFAGTPHRGSEKAKWATLAANLASLIMKDNNDNVVQALQRGSETLERLQNDFGKILMSLPVFSFFEELGYEKIGKIVDDESASLGYPHERRQYIHANHGGMVKFGSSNETGFERIAGAISELVDDAKIKASRPTWEQSINRGSRESGNRQFYEGRSPTKVKAISIKEHRFSEPGILSFGCDEIIEIIAFTPGSRWKGQKGNKKGFFLKNAVEILDSGESPSQDTFPDSWKNPGLRRQSTLTKQVQHTASWKRDAETAVPTPTPPPQPVHNSNSSQPEEPQASQSPKVNSTIPAKSGAGSELHEALLVAAEEGHVNAVKRQIDKGVDVNAKGGAYGYALVAAAFHGRKEVVKLLLQHGADTDSPGQRDGPALHAAAAQGHLDIVKVLLSRGANPQTQGGQFRFALTAAAFNGNVRIMRVLLDEGAELNATDRENDNALHGAVWGGHIEAVEFLLERGINRDVSGKENGTPLEMARNTGQERIARLLNGEDPTEPPATNAQPSVNASAPLDVNTEAEEETDPEVEAAMTRLLAILLVKSAGEGNLEDVHSLLEAGAPVTWTVDTQGTALHAACLGGHTEVAQVLLERGASVNALAGKVGYPFHAACCSGNLLLVYLLILWGANVGASGGFFGDALHAASWKGDLRIMKLLLDLGFPVNASGGNFGTPLAAAASNGGLDACQFLVQRGANPLSRTPQGFTMVDVARINNQGEAVVLYFKLNGVKSSNLFSLAGLTSRLASFNFTMEAIRAEQEEAALRGQGSRTKT